VVPILSRDCRRQPGNEPRFGTARDLLEALRRQVVALVHDEVSVISNAIIYNSLSDEALDERDVNRPARLAASAADSANSRDRQVQKCRQSVDPLFEQLLPVDEHKRIHAAPRDQPRRNHGLSEGRGRGQHSGIVGGHRLCRGLLLWPQFSCKHQFDSLTRIALVPYCRFDPEIGEQLPHIVETASGKSDVMRVLFGAGDHSRFTVGGQPHRLRLVEFRILEGGDAEQAISQGWWQALSGDVDFVRQHEFQPGRQFACNRRLFPAARWRRCPGFGLTFLGERKPDANHVPRAFGVAHQILDLRTADPCNRREKRPLIGVWIEIVIEEQAVAPLTRLLLQRQGDQVAESALRQSVLVGKEAVVRIQADVGPVLHRFRENQRTELAGECGRKGLVEKEPHVRAGSRA